MKLHLQSIHFAGSVLNPGNSLLLRCTSQIGNIYLETKEIELGTPQRDPIPARGNYHLFIQSIYWISLNSNDIKAYKL